MKRGEEGGRWGDERMKRGEEGGRWGDERGE
jgi:hypothetical protein